MKNSFKNKSRIYKRNLIDFWKTVRLFKFYILKRAASRTNKEIIIMFDGRMKHGGISDRLWGIVSMYKYCKDFNKVLKIYFKHPFNLQDFLIPNKVNWEITEREIKYDILVSRPKYISMVTHDSKTMYEILKNKLKGKKRQLHIYTNTRIIENKEFGKLFCQLFKMSPELEKAFNNCREKISDSYISCTFRFQQLLGDFEERGFKVIKTKTEKEALISQCVTTLKNLHSFTGKEILVTSDSSTFLNSLTDLSFVKKIEGEVIHPDFDSNIGSERKYLKSFLDLFMIANAEKVFLCNVKPLYRSGFPETAACIYCRPYYEITDFEQLNIKEF